MRRLAALLAGLGLVACGAPPGPNVLVAVFDACRPDKFGCYGFERPTTPEIDRFATDPDSVVFERHYVQATWTKPSTASLFTGLFLDQHQVSGGSGEGSHHEWSSVLPPELRTVAEDFQAAGFHTFGATTNHHLDRRFGFDQGFDVYSTRPRSDYDLLHETLRLLETTERPFFGYVHFIGCHYPFGDEVRDAGYMERHGFGYDETARIAAGIDFARPGMPKRVNERGFKLAPDDVRFLHLVYEARLRRMDRVFFGPLIRGLREAGLYDDTLVVLTSDHGEELYDHGGVAHGHALWEEVVRVPLIVKFPKGGRPSELEPRWAGLSRAIDLYPSLAAAAGLARPDSIPGVNLFRAAAAPFALVGGLGRDDAWAFVEGFDKVLTVTHEGGAAGPGPHLDDRRFSLYDLASDPREALDLAAARPEALERARRAVADLSSSLTSPRTSFDEVETEPLSEEAIESLRSLGYVD